MRNPAVALAWLTHPVSAVALLLLLVNDHFLKAAAPGLVTGKLSDVAGLVFAPALVASLCCLLVPRLPARPVAIASTAVVGAAFAAVKAVPGGAAVASTAWSLARPSTILADPTDLVALPALGIAWWAWRRSHAFAVPTTVARGVRAAVLLPLAVLGVAATSAPEYPAIGRVAVVDGRLAAYEYNDYHGEPTGYDWPWVTDDGLVWTEPAASAAVSSPRVTSACVPDAPGRCYRVVPGRLAVEETRDGGRTWRTSWQVTEGRRRFLARRHSELRSVRDGLSSVDIAVLPVAGGRHRVFVANQRDGVAVRQVDGTWRRVGLPSRVGPPTPDPLTGAGRHLGLEYAMALSFAVALYALGLVPALSRRRILAGSSAGAAFIGPIVLAYSVTSLPFPLDLLVAAPVLCFTVAGLSAWFVTVLDDPQPRWWLWIVQGLLAIGGAVGVAAAFHGWSAGWPDGYFTAVGLASGAVAIAALATVLLVPYGRRPVIERPTRLPPVPAIWTAPRQPSRSYHRPFLRVSIPRDEPSSADDERRGEDHQRQGDGTSIRPPVPPA